MSIYQPSGPTWWASRPIIRLAGVPMAVVDGLRTRETSGRIDDLLRLDESLRREGDLLVEALHDVIGALLPGGPKAGLVGLRRAVHQRRRPRSGEWADDVRSALPRDILDRVKSWQEDLAVFEAGMDELPAVLSAELDGMEPALRDGLRDPCFRRGLAKASPTLSAELEKWLRDPGRRMKRQSLLRALKYLTRAATKTSPFSTFMVAGRCEWTRQDDLISLRESRRPDCVVEVDARVTWHLVRSLLDRHPGDLRMNPSVVRHGEDLVFIGRPPHDPSLRVRRTPALEEILRLLASEHRPTRAELAGFIAGHGNDPAEAEAFITSLIRCGLVEEVTPIADQTGDPFAGLRSPLGEIAALQRSRVAIEDLAAERARTDELESALTRALAEAGAGTEVAPGVGRGRLHENVIYRETAAWCDGPAWEPVLDDLDAIRRWLAAFDPGLPFRLALFEWYDSMYGAREWTPFTLLYETLRREVIEKKERDLSGVARDLWRQFREPWSPVAGDSSSPRLSALADIQRQAREQILATPGDPIHVETDAIRKTIGQWPEWITQCQSVGFYVQPDPRGPRMVMNNAFTGYSRGLSRLDHLIGAHEPDVDPRYIVDETKMYAEFGHSFLFTPNIRRPALPYELDQPLLSSERRAAERLPMADIEVSGRAESGLLRLRSRSTGREIVPLHLGMMTEHSLPRASMILARGFAPNFFMTPGAGIFGPAMTGSRPGITRLRRVEVGHVVVRRARWRVPARDIPRRAAGESDAAYLVALRRWLRMNGLPMRSYMTFPRVKVVAEAANANQFERDALARKPLYVDFSNWFLVAIFERQLPAAGDVIWMEEALPDPSAGPLDRVHELHVEVSARRA
ncbi:lantibiotic dehydratase [[Actinomadura] parvosata]|uniref:lantibiotic dehydratase n=1 Tax=[Actinomadura] parvosata TaxID=1955412 RepID=UPI00406D4B41